MSASLPPQKSCNNDCLQTITIIFTKLVVIIAVDPSCLSDRHADSQTPSSFVSGVYKIIDVSQVLVVHVL